MRFSFRLQVGPAQFRVGSDWAAPIEALRSLYRDYPTGEEPSDFSVRLEAERPWRRWLRPSVAIRGDFMLPDAVPMSLGHGLLAAEMGMNLQMALGWRRHLLLHAATVERDRRALILTGLSGSGKSTLAALLGERGWRLMGDEFALLDLQSGLLQPFPRAVSLKNESVPEVEQMVGTGRMGPLLVGTPKGSIRHLRPQADAVARMLEPATPAAILFPRFGRDRPAAIRPVGPAEVFVRLTQASTNYVALGEPAFSALTRLVAGVPALAIDFPDTDAALAQVAELAA